MISRSVKFQLAVLFLLCCTAFFLRSFELYRDLFFGYDQGRDALEVQKILRGDITLIGPVTGLDGVFLGPFWYYLILPAYVIGSGNPVFVGYEMVLFAVGTILMLYLWGRKLAMPWAGIIAAILYTFSFQNIHFSRWAANPAPLPFFALCAFYFLANAIEQKKMKWFALSGILFGLCFQLEAANAFWFIPTVACIFLWEGVRTHQTWGKSIRWFLTISLIVAGGFLLTELPHILFELKYNFLITRNVITAFGITERVPIGILLPHRLELLYTLYTQGLFANLPLFFGGVIILPLFILFRERHKLMQNRWIRILLVWFCVPLFFHALYTGNQGNFWDYYIIAQHPVLYLLIAVLLVNWYRSAGKTQLLRVSIISGIITCSIMSNLFKWSELIQPYEGRFSLDMIVRETNWIIDKSEGKKYGVWVYAPNAQDEPHRYVYWWIGTQRHVFPEEHVEQQPLIFLAVEDDPIYWKRHKEWIQEKSQFGTVVDTATFGAIRVYKIENSVR